MRWNRAAAIAPIALLLATAAIAAQAVPSACAGCRAPIAEADQRYAAHVLEGVEPSAFDDLGCAVKWYAEQCATRALAFEGNAVVHDLLSGEPVPAEKAHYVRSPAFRTPKGHGLVAFRSIEDARRAAAQHGATVMSFTQAFALKLR